MFSSNAHREIVDSYTRCLEIDPAGFKIHCYGLQAFWKCGWGR